MRDQNTQKSFPEYALFVWRHRRLALLSASVFACLSLAVFNLLPRRYTASATFERTGDPVVQIAPKVAESFAVPKAALNIRLTGAAAVEQALTDLGMSLSPQAVEDLQKRLTVNWEINTPTLDRVQVSLACDDPILARQLPNQLVKNYVAVAREEFRRQLSDSSTYMEKQLLAATARESLSRQSQYAFAAEHPDIMPENPRYFSERIGQLDEQLALTQVNIDACRQKLAILTGLEGASGQAKPLTQPNPEHQALKKKIAELSSQIDRHLNVDRMTEKHPKVAQLTQALASSQSQLASVPVEIPADPATAAVNLSVSMEVQNRQAELSRLESDVQLKTEQRERLVAAQASAGPLLDQYHKLSTTTADASDEVKQWKARLADIRALSTAEFDGRGQHLQVAWLAGPVHRASWPSLKMVLSLSFGGAIVFGIAAVFVRGQLSRRFVSAAVASKTLELPLLGVINPVMSPLAHRRRSLQRLAVAPALALMLIVIGLFAGLAVIGASRPGRGSNLESVNLGNLAGIGRSLTSLIGG